MNKKLINPDTLYDGAAFGMSQAVMDPQTKLVFLSGQVDFNQQFKTTETSVEGQMKKALDNLQIALDAAGSSVNQLLLVRLYIRGEVGDHVEQVTPLLKSFFGESRPALTVIGVASLAYPEILVEIETVASVE